MSDPTITTSGSAPTARENRQPVPTTALAAARPTRRLGLRWLGAVLAASLLLGACSAIPPQPMNNPLGLDGQEVEVDFPLPLATQAVSGQGGGTFTVADFDQSFPLNPGALTNSIGIATARLSGATGPDTITITNPAVTVRLWHGAADYDLAPENGRAEVSLSTTATIVLKKGTCFGSGPTASCRYEYQSGPTSFGDLKLSGSTLSTLLKVMTEAPSPNNGSVSLTLQANPDELAGRTLTIQLEASEGEVRF